MPAAEPYETLAAGALQPSSLGLVAALAVGAGAAAATAFSCAFSCAAIFSAPKWRIELEMCSRSSRSGVNEGAS